MLPHLRSLCSLTLLGTALSFAPLPASAQLPPNRQDQELTVPYNRHTAAMGRQLDMAYTKEGVLVMAWIEHGYKGSSTFNRDAIMVVSYDPLTMSWTLLSQASYLDQALELDLALPARHNWNDADQNRVYLAVHFAQDVGTGTDNEWVGLVSGRYDQPWGPLNSNGTLKTNGAGKLRVVDLPQPTNCLARMHPSVACVPTEGDDFSEYSVELVFAYPEGKGGEQNIFWSRSEDYGKSFAHNLRLTGPGPDEKGNCTEFFQCGRYAAPTAASVDASGVLAVAFEDIDREQVHILTNEPELNELVHQFSTPAGDNIREFGAQLGTYEDEVFLTCLSEPYTSGGWALRLFRGLYFSPQNYYEVATVHNRANTPGHVVVRGSGIYIAARCKTDNPEKSAAPVHLFHVDGNANIAFDVYSDYFTLCAQPRVAVTRESVPTQRVSIGYPIHDWQQTGKQIWAGWIDVDL